VLDKYPECFSDSPGFCDLIQHEIHVSNDVRPKRLRSYRVPVNLKPIVEDQIQELLKLDIITPSKSEMGSPIVCVLKGKDSKDVVRIAVDYSSFAANCDCKGDAYRLAVIPDLILKSGTSPIHHTCQHKASLPSNWSETRSSVAHSFCVGRWLVRVYKSPIQPKG